MLTFDPCYMGESAGEPRRVSSPDMFSENFSAGVDFLGLLPYADRNKIGALGICGSGGFALSAAAVDTRIKAVVTASMYDMSYAARAGQTPSSSPQPKNGFLCNVGKTRKTVFPNISPLFPKNRRKTFPTKCRAYGANFTNFTPQSAVTTQTREADSQPPAICLFSTIRCCTISTKSRPAPSSLLSANRRRADFSATSPMQTQPSRRKCSSSPTATM